MKALGGSLFIIIFLAFLSVVFGSSFTGINETFSYSSDLILNGSVSDIGSSQTSTSFNINSVQGALLVLVGIVVFVSAIGIQVFGSGLQGSTIRTLTIITFYSGMWVLFSILAWTLIVSIEVFGTLLYTGLTVVYVYGVGSVISGGGGVE